MSKSDSDNNYKNINITNSDNRTKKSRYNSRIILYYFILSLNILQILSGIIFILIMEFYKNDLTKYVGTSEKGQISVIFLIMDLFEFQMIVISICGVPIIKRSMKDPYTCHLGALLMLWICLSILIILSGCVLFWAVYQSSPSLQRSTELSLLRGIELYYVEPEWRLIWDDMQYRQQCCGVHNYKDWQTTAWVAETTDNIAECDKNNEIDHSESLSLTPYSCCKKNCGCFESFIPSRISSDSLLELPTLNISAINTEGCLNFFSDTLENVTSIYLIQCSQSSVMQILIIMLLRVLFIKSRNYKMYTSENKEEDYLILKCKCYEKCSAHDKLRCCRCCIKESSDNCKKNEPNNNEDNECDGENEFEEDDENEVFTGLIIH